jgi:hypothetical protein
MLYNLIPADNNRFLWLMVANFLYLMLHLATNLFLCPQMLVHEMVEYTSISGMQNS